MRWRYVAGVFLLALAGCGRSGGGPPPSGTALVTLTASESGFLAYRVTLVSVRLLSTDGTQSIEALPVAMTIDLAHLADLDELLGAVPSAPGTFTKVVLTLDYAEAEIIVDDGTMTGMRLSPADASGRMRLTLALDPAAPLEVTAGHASRIALDVDLRASNDVDRTRRIVTVAPVVAASAHAADAKPIRVRGPLVSVDAAGSRLAARVRPFDGQISGAGELVVNLGDITTYEINGTPYLGAAGAAQLAGRGGTLVLAYGNLNPADESFTANRVYAGSSVEGGGFDRLSGIVATRSRDALTVIDASLLTNGGAASFLRGEVPVTVGAGTAVTVAGEGGVPPGGARARSGLAPVSVGSQILAFGKALGLGPDAAPGSPVSFDATAGRVRVVQSQVSGLVAAHTADALTIRLATLGGRAAALFDFTGTGSSPASDAQPDRYRLGVAGLDPPGAPPGAPVVARGVVSAFGAAPPDFLVVNLKDPGTLAAQLIVDWGGGGSAAPFKSAGPLQLDLDFGTAARTGRHAVLIGPVSVDPAASPLDTLIVPDPSASDRLFAIAHRASAVTESFDSYAPFAARLAGALHGTTVLRCLSASGQYAAAVNTVTANRIAVSLSD